MSVRPIGDFADRRVTGVDIGYGAPYEGPGWRWHRWRNRPCCFLHFDVFRRAEGRRYVPKGARPATLGGRRGLLAEAREGAYFGSGIYWGNHVRFLWREGGVPWVATLHTFGEEETERLLGRLIESLRPVDRLPQGGAGAVPLGATPSAIVVGRGYLWVSSLGDFHDEFRGTVSRVDPATGRVLSRFHPGRGPRAIALSGATLWVSMELKVARFDARTGERLALIDTGGWPRGVATVAGGVWVLNAAPFSGQGSLVRIDLATHRVVGRRVQLGRAPTALAVAGNSAWVVDELDGTLTRVTLTRQRVGARIDVGRGPTSVAAGAGSIWVANTGESTVSRVEPATNRVTATMRAGLAPRGIAFADGAVWVAATGDGTVRRIDPATNRVTIAASGLGDPLAVAVTGGKLWATTNADGHLLELVLPTERIPRPETSGRNTPWAAILAGLALVVALLVLGARLGRRHSTAQGHL